MREKITSLCDALDGLDDALGRHDIDQAKALLEAAYRVLYEMDEACSK